MVKSNAEEKKNTFCKYVQDAITWNHSRKDKECFRGCFKICGLLWCASSVKIWHQWSRAIVAPMVASLNSAPSFVSLSKTIPSHWLAWMWVDLRWWSEGQWREHIVGKKCCINPIPCHYSVDWGMLEVIVQHNQSVGQFLQSIIVENKHIWRNISDIQQKL